MERAGTSARARAIVAAAITRGAAPGAVNETRLRCRFSSFPFSSRARACSSSSILSPLPQPSPLAVPRDSAGEEVHDSATIRIGQRSSDLGRDGQSTNARIPDDKLRLHFAKWITASWIGTWKNRGETSRIHLEIPPLSPSRRQPSLVHPDASEETFSRDPIISRIACESARDSVDTSLTRVPACFLFLFAEFPRAPYRRFVVAVALGGSPDGADGYEARTSAETTRDARS